MKLAVTVVNIVSFAHSSHELQQQLASNVVTTLHAQFTWLQPQLPQANPDLDGCLIPTQQEPLVHDLC